MAGSAISFPLRVLDELKHHAADRLDGLYARAEDRRRIERGTGKTG